jgi:hypothetical protein
LVFQTISAIAVIIGIIFGIINITLFRASRKRESAIVMLNSFQTFEFVRGLLQIFELPDGAGQQDVDGLPHEQYLSVYMVLGTWERLGILVYRREIPLELVDDAFSGPIIQSWQKLEKYIHDFRARVRRDTAFEWFQWLAERMMDRERHAAPVPAYVAHKGWKP